MTTTKFFEVILATLKKEYGNKFDSMSQAVYTELSA